MSKYKRILLKISGEALMGDEKFGHDNSVVDQICSDIKSVYDLGHEICLVVGGGNICRGAKAAEIGIDRATGDYMGMLATVINAIALQSKLESMGLKTRVLSAIPMINVSEQYIRRRAMTHIAKGRIVIFASGTGNPFFTTDTAAVLRATEMNCDLILKGAKVDGVYSSDPNLDKSAKKYDFLTHRDVINKNLKVMDTTSITLASDNEIPIMIFNIHKKNEFLKVLGGKGSYTLIQ